MEDTPLRKAQKYLESVQMGAPTQGEAAITWTLIGLAANLGRVASALETLATRLEQKEGK